MRQQSEKIDITELDREELVSWFEENGMRSFRADQVMCWLYGRGITSFEEMTDISKAVRGRLSEHFVIRPLETAAVETASDGTRKFLFELADGNRIETVLIPERDHYTLCISTQVGCAMGCRFCMTAKGGLIRSLTRGEIIGQVLACRDHCTGEKRLTNLVLMGMGEPLANYENVIRAIRVITDAEKGLGLSVRRVTLSTAGLAPKLADLAADSRIRLAISLNATDNKTRDMLMPINRTYPIETLLAACARYPLAPRDRITFEYILLKGVNDSPEDARRLARLLTPIKAKINLIPFNPHENSEFERPDQKTIDAFQSILVDKHFTTIIRWSKGTEIAAACGQLRGKKAG